MGQQAPPNRPQPDSQKPPEPPAADACSFVKSLGHSLTVFDRLSVEGSIEQFGDGTIAFHRDPGAPIQRQALAPAACC
jgi:hypothetical protein